ncbi:Protein SPT10 like protein [Verticillium longisporum]|nr:Protein SPT10 like protein [Verticillium longisporum]
MLLGNIEQPSDLADLPEAATGNWSKTCLGSFYIKPNYPGRSSHVCNAGFLVTDASRGRGVGRLMGECYLDWAPKLGYTYSVFNLVYETNVASCKIWDALGFKRIGRVKGCGDLRSYPGQLVDAIIYGRDLVPGEFPEDLAGVERFDKIKFYLKYNKYPVGADRHEKSRLRSAATHYRLVAGDRLMLKDKEVIPDPRRQYEIARDVHVAAHGGINKTTATIAERYHWSRIKETVSDVIRNCVKCKELGKAPVAANGGGSSSSTARNRAAPADAVSPVSPAAPSAPPPSLSAAPPSAPDELAAIADPAVAAYRYPSPDGGSDPYAYQTETDFQALLNATAGEDERHAEADDAAARREAEAVDRDLDMLIEQGDEDETMSGVGRGEDDDVQEPVTLDVAAEEAKVKAIYALSYADG